MINTLKPETPKSDSPHWKTPRAERKCGKEDDDQVSDVVVVLHEGPDCVETETGHWRSSRGKQANGEVANERAANEHTASECEVNERASARRTKCMIRTQKQNVQK